MQPNKQVNFEQYLHIWLIMLFSNNANFLINNWNVDSSIQIGHVPSTRQWRGSQGFPPQQLSAIHAIF